jgi:hypothetical protein
VESQDPQRLLAQRLRALREESWPGRRVTQQELARALGGVSGSLISSWESLTGPRLPPLARLETYAILFATRRSFEGDAIGPLSPSLLSDDERQAMEELKRELRDLRNGAMRASSRGIAPVAADTPTADIWRFPDQKEITIVCAQLPQEMLDQIPYTKVDDPDYIELLTYSELDSLFELHGHIRAANPSSEVNLRVAAKLSGPDYQSHLVVLGGVDWNVATSEVLERLALPVRQVADWSKPGGQYYEVYHGKTTVRHRPILENASGRPILREDVALFARAVNPFDRKRTVSICNGMYGRGTLGAVRALTDRKFRDRNAEYIQPRIAQSEAYCLLTKVPVVQGTTLTPDWTSGEHVLFDWSR